MRGLSLLPLDDDILDRILILLPDFSTLGTTILASKHLYTVFKARRHSITQAVAYNMTGVLLPQAMRVLRYGTSWIETDPIIPITSNEIKRFVKNASVVAALENLFGLRHKGRKYEPSNLSQMESWRFQRALYRIMLFNCIFPGDEMDLDEDIEYENITEARLKRKELLLQFPDDELLSVHSVAMFLSEAAEFVEDRDGSGEFDGFGDVALSYGPAAILEAYTTTKTQGIRGRFDYYEVPPIVKDYLAHPLSEIWRERKTQPPPEDASHFKSILD